MQKNIIILGIVIVVIGSIFWYYKKTREGFQTAPVPITSILNSPDQATPNVCVIVNNIHQQLKAQYIKIKNENNPYLTDMLTASIKSSEEQLNKMGCAIENT